VIQYRILKYSPGFLLWYRTRFLLDWPTLTSHLPEQGRLLDVGCGVGLVDYKLARHRPNLNVTGIDITRASVELAQTFHKLPNTEYLCQPLQAVEGQFDCIFFTDVFHHVRPQEYEGLLEAARRLLAPGGYILIKDVERRLGQVSLWMDKYISGCTEIYLHNRDELVRIVSQHLTVQNSETKYSFPFPHYYIHATHPPDALAGAAK
jgi:cyclopropane fatty-acyl-phospholipid synthase-like methyltransferase